MEADPPGSILYFLGTSVLLLQSSGIAFGFLLLVVLIICSALISGSEVAYFSISPKEMLNLKDENSAKSNQILALKEKPRVLLATILISNNFINIAIVILSDFILRNLLTDSAYGEMANVLVQQWGWDFISEGTWIRICSILITTVLVTFILVLLGEITPKIYANIHNIRFAKFMSLPLSFLKRLLGPISYVLVNWTNSFEKKIIQNRSAADKKELDRAIELTVKQDISSEDEEASILKGIIKFGDHTVKQIMKSRVDVTALENSQDFIDILSIIRESGYSRIPVFEEDFDNVVGILYVKDLLGHTDEGADFKWHDFIRKDLLYVPEAKKISVLLKEFQVRRLHMAVVVDEYGGSSGLVTLEDIMEEVIGDIKDEFDDEEEVDYLKIDDNNYIFEGKTLLNDLCRIIGEETDIFDDIKGESDSIAGLFLEVIGRIPKVDKEINFNKFKFKIVAASKRRIEKVSISMRRE